MYFRVMMLNVVVGLFEMRLGIIFGVGGIYCFFVLIGINRVRDLIFIGRRVFVLEVYFFGLVDRLVEV